MGGYERVGKAKKYLTGWDKVNIIDEQR